VLFRSGDFKVDIEGLKNISLESIFNDMQTKGIEDEDEGEGLEICPKCGRKTKLAKH
jgi:hypothetical protein